MLAALDAWVWPVMPEIPTVIAVLDGWALPVMPEGLLLEDALDE